MADIAGAVVGAVACVAQCLSPQGEHQINRWRGFKRSFKILKTEVKKLKAERTGLQRRVNLAKKNGDGIEENVQNWLERAEEIEVEIQKWLEKACMLTGDDMEAVKIRNDDETAAATEATEEIGGDAEIAVAAAAREIREGEETVAAAAGEIGADEEKKAAKRRCFKWFCRNLKSRYQLSKEAETLLEDVVKHLKDKKFDKISHPVILKDPRLSSKDYEAFESRTSTLKNVISSLSDPNVNIVGIYGMGGIGKTTLAKEVAKQPEASKLFDSVIFVEVTVKPHIIKIQEEIAHKLPGLTFSHKEIESTRATELYQRLEKEKNILIILDNIWAEINLEAIGIPLGDGRKLLLTARSSYVLSVKMESQRNFPVQFLNDEEAWQLFKKMSRDDIEGTEFEPVARDVVKKCARLPIVVVTIAKALKKKELFAWRNASQQMGLSFSADIQHIHASIKLSFDYLETENLKKTILLIGYANITSIDKLLMYGMGVALFEDVNEMERRRDRVLTLVQELKDSCLLLDSNTTGEDFSMHDVVHEVAMSVASSDPQVLTKLQSLDKNALEVCRSIVLKDVETGDIPRVLQCQQLKLLSISGGPRRRSLKLPVDIFTILSPLRLPDEFFLGMTELEVLVLAHVDLRSLSPSLHCLTNLQALSLFECYLDDIAIIGNLKKLEILSLENSYFKQLPEEVGHFNLLKSLDLRGCHFLDVIAPNVLSSLSHLEELYMGDFSRWEEEGLNKDRENVSLDELKNLSNLTRLEIEIRDAKTLPRDLFFNKLERYKISIGPDMRRLGMRESCRNFNLSLINTNICLNDGHIMQLKKIEDLCLVGSQDMKSVLYGLDRDGFQHLKYLEVGENCNLWCIVDSMKYATTKAFPVLESLLIYNLINLEKICHGRLTTQSSFSQLRRIDVEGCAKLENIFSFSIARRLQLLQSIDVSRCENMKEIFAIEREDESNCNISEVIDTIEFSQLRSLHLRDLPQLNTIFNGKVALPNLEKLILIDCNNLKCLFSSSMIGSFDRLQYLQIKDCQTLEEIMVINDEDGLRKEERHNNVPNLTMMVRGCHKLKTLFSQTTYKKFLRLESLSISNCDLLEVIFDLKGPDFENKHNAVVIPQLSKLEIVCLPKLKQVWNNDPKISVSFEKLEEVSIVGCEVLKNVFPASFASSLSQLKGLDIRECGVEKIVFVVEEEAETSSRFVLPKVALPRLEELVLIECNNLKCLFSSSTIGSFDRLQYLEIYNCKTLEEIMIIDDEDGLRKEERKNNVPNLKMMVRGCHKLKTLFSRNTYKKFFRLESLFVSNCDLLEVIFDLKGPDFENKHNAVVITQLSKLEIDGLPKLKQVWNNDPKISISFEKLEEVSIVRCEVLKNVFPASVASNLSQLKNLDISECEVEEIVFVVDEEAETSSRFVFPKLISLTLHDLPNFTTFFSGRYIKEWRSSLLVEKIFQSLERLVVEGKILEDLFCKLHCLEVSLDNSSGISSPDFLQRFHRIKSIAIRGDNLGYFFSMRSMMSSQITNLNNCSDLKHILKEESNMDHLIHLEVKYCVNLVNLLMPSSTSLRNLTTLVVSKCNRLTNIVTSSTATSMGQLREMEITECFMMTELVLADEGDEANDNEIVFSELKKLVLQDLGCLTSFWSANYTLEFPSLEEILVEKCPAMKSFTKGNLRTPKIQNVKLRRNMQVEECWKGNLNTTIEELYKGNLMICNEDEEVNTRDDDRGICMGGMMKR